MVHEPSQKTFLVTGATGGIGSKLAQKLSRHGYRVILAARNEEKLKKLSSELDQPSFLFDAVKEESVKALFEFVQKEQVTLSGIAHCVGSLLLKPGHLTSQEEWSDTISKNLTSSFLILRHAIKPMRNAGGSVVFVSSAAASIGLQNHEAIAAAKAGIEGLVKSAAATYAKNSIRVNCVSPGLVETPMTEKIFANEASRKSSEKMHPLGRLGKPKDIAQAIYWILSTENSWMTGQCVRVDGGLSGLKPIQSS